MGNFIEERDWRTLSNAARFKHLATRCVYHGRTARLSWPGWLIAHQQGRPSHTNRAGCRPTWLIETIAHWWHAEPLIKWITAER